jgi:hypothetical protein
LKDIQDLESQLNYAATGYAAPPKLILNSNKRHSATALQNDAYSKAAFLEDDFSGDRGRGLLPVLVEERTSSRMLAFAWQSFKFSMPKYFFIDIAFG